MGLALTIILFLIVFPLWYGHRNGGAAGIVAVVMIFAWFAIPPMLIEYVSKPVGVAVIVAEIIAMISYLIYCNVKG